MRIINDWKYAIGLVVAISGIAVPVWLWQVDLNSKNVSITILSQTAIAPPASNQVSGIEVTYKGDQISYPYLSLIEIKNNGSKPIIASDIESPINIKIDGSSKLRVATVTERSPKDFDPKINFTDSAVFLKPALMNPDDRVVLAIVTSDKLPSLTASARISGINDINIVHAGESKASKFLNWAYLLIAISFTVAGLASFEGVLSNNGVFINMKTAILISFITLVAGSGFLLAHTKSMGLDHIGYGAYVFGISIVGVIIANKLNRSGKIIT